jgi:hypothetical protein
LLPGQVYAICPCLTRIDDKKNEARMYRFCYYLLGNAINQEKKKLLGNAALGTKEV